MDIRFYKTKNLPDNAPSGSLWFNPETKRISLINSSGNVVFGSEIQSAEYKDGVLTLTKYNEGTIKIPIGNSSSTTDIENKLATKLNKIKVNNTEVSSIDLNLKGANGTTVTESSGTITISSKEVPTKVSQLDNDSNYINSIKTINGQDLKGSGNITISTGTTYTLPTASADTLGGVKVGAGLAITDGVLSATGGGVADSVDWKNIQGTPKTFTPAAHTHQIADVSGLQTALDNKVTAVSGKGLSTKDFTAEYETKLNGLSNYSLPTASSMQLGGVKVGAGLTINNGVLSATGGGTADSVDWSNVTNKPTIPDATTINSTSGNFTLGTGLELNGSKINCTVTAGSSYALPKASTTQLGGVSIGTGVKVDGNGKLSVDSSKINLSECNNNAGFITSSDLPSVKDGTTFTPKVDDSGVISWTNDGGKTNPTSVNITGPQGNPGNDGETPYIGTNGNWFIGSNDTGVAARGPKGDTGADGTGVTILGSYTSLSELKAAHPTGNAGDSYLIDGSLYVWSVTESTWKNVGTIQGPKGDKGDTGDNGITPHIGTDGYWYVGSTKTSVFAKGDPGTNGTNGKNGADGVDGVGITNITSTNNTGSGAENTITVSLSDNTTKTFKIKNGTNGTDGVNGKDGVDGTNGTDGAPGVGISSITATNNTGSGATNTVTMTLTDGTKKEFSVKNGTNGTNGANTKDAHYSPSSSGATEVGDVGKFVYKIVYDSKGHVTQASPLKFKTVGGSTIYTSADSETKDIALPDISTCVKKTDKVTTSSNGIITSAQMNKLYDFVADTMQTATDTEYGGVKIAPAGGIHWHYDSNYKKDYIQIDPDTSRTTLSLHETYGLTLGVATDTKIGGFKTGNGVTIDTSGYIDISEALNGYAKTSDIPSLSGYVTNTALNTTLKDYVTNTALTSTLSGYVTNDTLNTTLSGYVKSSVLNGYVTSTTLTQYAKKTDIPTVPTNLSSFTNDTGYITASSIPAIPTKLSSFTNDLSTETWTFTLEDGSTVTKNVHIKA